MKKQSRITIRFSFMLIFMAAMYASSALCAQMVVDHSGGGDYESLSAAVADALINNGPDEIIVKPGVYVDEQNVGEILYFTGADDITIRGEDPADRPIIVVEPNHENSAADSVDGVIIQMGGQLTFENLIFVPSENFTMDNGVDDLIAVFNAEAEGNQSWLELTFRNVVITHSDFDNQPVTTDGFDDPRYWDNTLRDDAINIDVSAAPNDHIDLLLDNVVITGYGTASDSDALVLDGPEIVARITEGSRFTYIRRRGIYAYSVKYLIILGTDENPVLIYGAGETMIRASDGSNNWSHLWCVGLNEGDGGINTGFAARVDPNGIDSLDATNCIFSTALSDGLFMNFDSEEPILCELRSCTFYNVPELIRFGFAGEPGPSANVTMRVIDTIIDNQDWTAPNDGTYWAPEPTVVHYGDGDNTLAQLTFTNLAYRTQTFTSSMSGSRSPTTDGNIIEMTDFQFAATELTRDNFSEFMVAENSDALAGKGIQESYLGGARSKAHYTDIMDWSIY